jgi:uncharacterized protein YndB with AHSA1/START domain
MNNQSFTTTLMVDQAPKEVFNAITNVRGWWSEGIEGSTDQLNNEFAHRDRYLYVKMMITHLTSEKVVWDIVESHNNMFLDNIHEWDDTRIVFEITEKAGKTEIRFTHVGLAPEFECYTVCSNSWDFFISTSLKNLIENGKGDPISKEYASFTTSITVDKSPEEVFKAVNNVRGWWLDTIEGRTDKLNDEFKFYVEGRLQFHFKIIELIPNKKVVWLVVDQNFKVSEDNHEWRGTTVIFEISRKDSQTQIRFTHQGLVPQLECYDTCQNSWTRYIQTSLFNFIKKGEGQPNKW